MGVKWILGMESGAYYFAIDCNMNKSHTEKSLIEALVTMLWLAIISVNPISNPVCPFMEKN